MRMYRCDSISSCKLGNQLDKLGEFFVDAAMSEATLQGLEDVQSSFCLFIYSFCNWKFIQSFAKNLKETLLLQ